MSPKAYIYKKTGGKNIKKREPKWLKEYAKSVQDLVDKIGYCFTDDNVLLQHFRNNKQ